MRERDSTELRETERKRAFALAIETDTERVKWTPNEPENGRDKERLRKT